MSGITGLGTTYDLPNYTGILHQLTPSDTPLFSAIGALTGGGQTTSIEFEWEAFDLRAAGQNTRVEGADAPNPEERVRENITNLVQIHQESVAVSYTKLAATGQKSGVNNNAVNPVQNELDWQVAQMLKQMVRDVEYSFIRGRYVKPGNNSTARKTRGLLEAIATNRVDGSTFQKAATLTASSGNVTANAHGLADGTQVYLKNVATTTSVAAGVPYWVVSSATNTFKLAATKGGAPVAINADGTADVFKASDLGVETLEDLLQSAYDNGGLAEGSFATLILNSAQKRKLSNAYAMAYGKYVESSRTVGGVNFTTIETNFGTVNVMLDRFVPQDTIIAASLEHLMPVYLEVPGKGHFFAEPLAKTGASDKVQLYGEVGLAFGPEKAHGAITGLAI